MSRRGDEESVLICNPVSGSEDHVDRITTLARDRGFRIELTENAGDATRLARKVAANGARLVAAAGGDGTINEVVNGLVDADALEGTTLAVVPVGTGNNFASNIGVESIDDAFEVIETGRRRRIDLGVANGRAFVNSCVGGVTAEASGVTSSEEKRTWGVLAYVGKTLETVSSFESLPLRAVLENGNTGGEAHPASTNETDRTRVWTGDAMFVLVGNCRRFTTARRAQANVEDGLFEVTIVEDASTIDLVTEAALGSFFDRDQTHIVRQRVPSVTVESRRSGPIEYSLDGELLEAETLEVTTHAGALEVAVGADYRIDPDGNGVDDSESA
ncbi:diacylglycerol/lipid kinase family protein [Natronorubrum texcoconense]|uniref:Lipid kinase, YegS/Rv2252/BmrU family n=1 Tax=Natronorubrum texcoconense TaxID=1095776 RepID=A0A1G8Y7F9_9EURY|nr:diacylglycerol kinase family protein [Natronorubrum texcoconense]SDJ98587.1 lipid kinase, YegS/Rv2252/BmrU family [Natronorubrum texcoconense]